MQLRRSLALLAILAVSTLAATACASSSAKASSSTAVSSCQQGHMWFAKTKFVLHAGLAFGAFHRYIWKPYKAGTFTGPDKKKAYVKAGIAALFIYHEVKVAEKDAMADKHLCKIGSALDQFGASLSTLGTKLKGGTASVGDIGANSSLFEKLLKLTGINPHDVAVPGA